jgi:hypothetical protein
LPSRATCRKARIWRVERFIRIHDKSIAHLNFTNGELPFPIRRETNGTLSREP